MAEQHDTEIFFIYSRDLRYAYWASYMFWLVAVGQHMPAADGYLPVEIQPL